MNNQRGFTFIELMTVVAIIGILAAIAIPQFAAYRTRAYRAEGYQLADAVKKNIIDYFDHTGRLPKDNAQAGVAAPELLRGKYVDRITVVNGTIRVEFQLNKKVLYSDPVTLTPEINQTDPTAPLLWTDVKK